MFVKDQKFIREIKVLSVFLVSGVFAKLHKEFMSPPKEIFSTDHWTNSVHHWFHFLHHLFHFLIGLAIQILLLMWLLRIGVAAWRILQKEWKDQDN